MGKRAVILAGDNSHDPVHAFKGITPILSALGLDVTCTTEFQRFTEHLTDATLLVIARDGMEFPDGRGGERVIWMRPDQEEAIAAFVQRGGGFLALHNAGWAYPWRGAYRHVLGGYYIGHPPIAEFHVEVIDAVHPITRGIASYDIVDEQHMLHWDHDRVTPLLISTGQDGRGTVSGWAYALGEGRVVYLPHGHTIEVIRHPSNVALLKSAAEWLLQKEKKE